MEGIFKRRMRNTLKHLQEEEELSRLPKVTSVAEMKCVELYTPSHCQFSKHLEDTSKSTLSEEEADCDLHSTKHRHQGEYLVIQRHLLMEQRRLIEALQKKIKYLQEELKKVKDLDVRKSTIISDLLLERENLNYDNKELVRMYEEKQQLCDHFEEELNMQKRIICDLLSDKSKLQRESELVGVSVQMRGEKQQLCKYFEEKLSRSLLCRNQQKRCFVRIWQTCRQDTKPEDKEDLEKRKSQLLENMVKASLDNLKTKKSEESKQNVLGWLEEVSDTKTRPSLADWLKESLKDTPETSRKDVGDWMNMSLKQLQEGGPEASLLSTQEWIEASLQSIRNLPKSETASRSSLRKEWLDESIENLQKRGGSVDNVLPWLQGSLENLLSSTEPKPVLETYLQGSLKNLEGDNQDVKEWLQISINNLEEEGPHMDTQEWLEASIKALQDLQKSEAEVQSSSLRKEWLEKSIENLKKQYSEAPADNILPWLQGSLENLLSSTEPKPDVEKWLQDSLKNLEEDNQDVKEWLPTATSSLKEDSEERRAGVEESREKLILIEPAPSEKSLRKGWLEASLANSREHGSTSSRTGLQGWLGASLGKLRRETPGGSRSNLEEWLKESMQNIQEEYPEGSRQDMKEWLEISQKHLKEPGPGTSHLSVEEWLDTSIQSLREDIFKEMRGRKDSEMRRRKSLSKIKIVRRSLGTDRCRKKRQKVLKTLGLILLLALFLFALYAHWRRYCVVIERGLRPY